MSDQKFCFLSKLINLRLTLAEDRRFEPLVVQVLLIKFMLLITYLFLFHNFFKFLKVFRHFLHIGQKEE